MLLFESASLQDLTSAGFISEQEIAALNNDEHSAKLAAGIRAELQGQYDGADASQFPATALVHFAKHYFSKMTHDGSYESLIADAFIKAHTAFTQQCEQTHGERKPTFLKTLQQCIALAESGKVAERKSDLEAESGKRVSTMKALFSLLKDDMTHFSETSQVGLTMISNDPGDIAGASFPEQEVVATSLPVEAEEVASASTGLIISDLPEDAVETIGLDANELIVAANKFGLSIPQVVDLAHVTEKGVSPKEVIRLLEVGHDFDEVVEQISVVSELGSDSGMIAYETRVPKGRELSEVEQFMLEADKRVIDFAQVKEFKDHFGLEEDELAPGLLLISQLYRGALEALPTEAAETMQGGRTVISQALKDARSLNIHNLELLRKAIEEQGFVSISGTRLLDEDPEYDDSDAYEDRDLLEPDSESLASQDSDEYADATEGRDSHDSDVDDLLEDFEDPEEQEYIEDSHDEDEFVDEDDSELEEQEVAEEEVDELSGFEDED